MLQKLVPRFLKKADQYLLKNHPLIWRTRIHFVAFYSLIVGNIAAVGLGLMCPISLEEIPDFETLNNLIFASELFAGFGLVWWGYSQYKIKLHNADFKTYLLTGLIYLGGTISIWFNILHLDTTVQYQLANLVENEQFDRDWADSRQVVGGYNLESPIALKKTTIFPRYKVENASEDYHTQMTLNNSELRNKMLAINQAKYKLSQYPNYCNPHIVYSVSFSFVNSTFYFKAYSCFLFIPLILLLCSKINATELFSILFFQVLLFFGSLFTMSLCHSDVPSSTSFAVVVLSLFAILYTKNKRWSALLFSAMASAITMTLFFDYRMHFDFFSTNFFYIALLGLVCAILNSMAIYFLGKRSIKPVFD